jgi:hypothetical protein
MKCYSFINGTLTQGIAVDRETNSGREVIVLGENGVGHRHREVVGLTHRHHVDIIGGKVYEAQPVHMVIDRGKQGEERSFFVLARPNGPPDAEVLVHIRSCVGDFPGCSGEWEVLQGEPKTLVHAYGAHGTGQFGIWDDDLVMLSPGDAIIVHDAGSGHWVLEYTWSGNEPRVRPYDDSAVHNPCNTCA